MRRFGQFACFDWSGQAVARPKGIALAVTEAGAKAPALVAPVKGWSRGEALHWLGDRAAENADMLIGFDFSAALPFVDHGSYFPGWGDSPGSARALWQWIDTFCAAEPHFSASTILEQDFLAQHFRYQVRRETITGTRFEGPLGRLRVTEQACRTQKRGNAVSCFNLVGAAQVGKSSLTGMRILHRLGGAIPIWPYDAIPEQGPMLVEIYTGIAARAAGLTGPTKLRDGNSLDEALASLGSAPHNRLLHYDDHSTDAILASAWLRRAANDSALWNPARLSAPLAQTEGWTFGVA
ncbi:hypothetical protein [Parasphingopyxis lamellibrachiae]|uniref:Uncharacterized protein n=1 Tax=Parasphingopyxis lamellibrachiae TaxID=680125 RepID=A0A3D9FBW2_9SPHN|nr:hypothetical protein [Parasphingopyxis lamellibrachiae]RED15027.1 hypothetical protein DFR46_0011 [Parasphingopyxis lamellibrachiae]